jgi:hypothetical protein
MSSLFSSALRAWLLGYRLRLTFLTFGKRSPSHKKFGALCDKIARSSKEHLDIRIRAFCCLSLFDKEVKMQG